MSPTATYSNPLDATHPALKHLPSKDKTVPIDYPIHYAGQTSELARNPAFHRLLDELRALHDSKNHDYANDKDPLSNFRAAERMGVEPWRAILIRMSDKWSRLEQLATGKLPKNESMRDTLIDLSAYSLLAIVLLDESAGAVEAGNGEAATTGPAGATRSR